MIRMILLVLFIAVVRTPVAVGDGVLGNDGTLPLRLGGDGTLPLRLAGQASSVAATSVATKVTITQVTEEALGDAGDHLLTCKLTGTNLSKHKARGTVLVGLAQFAIKGICYNHDTSQMEVVAERSVGGSTVERSFMSGVLAAPTPAAFAGSLVVTGSAAPAGRYTFSTRATNQ